MAVAALDLLPLKRLAATNNRCMYGAHGQASLLGASYGMVVTGWTRSLLRVQRSRGGCPVLTRAVARERGLNLPPFWEILVTARTLIEEGRALVGDIW